MAAPKTPAEETLGTSLPHRRVEAWKYTDLRGQLSETAGGLSSALTPRFDLPDGVTLTEETAKPSGQIMGDLAASFASTVWTLNVPAGFKGEAALVDGLTRGHGRIAIHLGEGAAFAFTEHHRGDAKAFVNLDLTVSLAKGAHLTRTIIHDEPETVTRISTANIELADEAKFDQFALSFGGALCRFETRLTGNGENVESNIYGAYLLSDKRHCDMTSHVQLAAPHALIRQGVKGVVTDTARGVFQGKFHVERPAQHTDAEMRHDALMLSDTAQIRSKPELEIYADDVACAHGNTIGQLDESALFYMRQRGIPQAQARALLTQAFVADVFDDLDDEALRESLVGKIADWLGA